MSVNIIELIKSQIGPALISQASTNLGESESSISKAISALLPTVVGGLANNADKPGILDSILGASSRNLLGNLMGDSNASMIGTIITALFGDKVGAIANSVSGYSGVSNSSANSLLNMVTGASVGAIGKYAGENNIGSTGLSSILSDQKGLVSSLLPAGLSFASLGLGDWGSNVDSVTNTVHTEAPVSDSAHAEPLQSAPVSDNVKVTAHDEPAIDVTRAGSTHMNVEPEENDNGGSIWKWLLPLVLLLLAGWFLWKQCDKKDVNGAAGTTDSTMVNQDSMNAMPVDSANMTGVTKVDEDIDLNGTMIKGYRGGMEDNMIAFLKANKYNDAADDAALKDTWYNFDKVNFEMASSTELLAGSEMQLQNLVAILKAYPESKIKIGGYTDNTGDAAINKALSQKRADFLRKQLTDMGVGSQVTGAEGYGSEMATVPATASDAERAVDRNMAVRFTK